MPRYIALLIVACMTLVGCATGPAKAPSVDVTGKWQGQWARTNAGGPVTMMLQQTNANVTGDVVVGGLATNTSGPVHGTVSGDQLSIYYRGGMAHFTVNGNEMSGSSAMSRWTLKRE